MNNKLSGVAKTLFIPLWARIYVSKNYPKYFYDREAISLENIFDFKEVSLSSNQYQIMANCSRAYIFNDVITKFINKYSNCNLIYLGVGLDTSINKFAQIANVNCYGIDFEDVINLRKNVFPNEELINSNIFDYQWINNIKNKDLPTLFLAQGVFQYCDEKDIFTLFNNIKNSFSNSQIVFDATNSCGMKYANKYVKKTGNNALIKFSVDDINLFINQTNTSLIEERPFFKEALTILKKELKFITKLFMRVVDKKKRAKVIFLKI